MQIAPKVLDNIITNQSNLVLDPNSRLIKLPTIPTTTFPNLPNKLLLKMSLIK